MQKTFITSDWHFSHKNILKYQPNRPGKTIEEMNSALIKHWNETVKPEDTIYHLGDFTFHKDPKEFIDQLNGKKIFILGNHDVKSKLEQYGECHQYREITYNKHLICLFHFPITYWNQSENNSLHFYGHFKNHGKSMDVGYDAHNRILSMEEAIDMVKDREPAKRVYSN